MSDTIQMSDISKKFLHDPKLWISAAIALFTAGSAVAVMENGHQEHIQTTNRLEDMNTRHTQEIRESLDKLINEMAVTRRVQEETLDVLRVMCVMNAQTKDMQRSCISRR